MKIKGKLKIENGRIPIPEKFKECNKLVITLPYAKEIIQGRTNQMYFREAGKEKPYIEDGHCSFKEFGKKYPEEVYMVVDKDGKKLSWFSKEKVRDTKLESKK